MLLVHPVREILRFLPALIALAIAGAASGSPDWWHFGGVVLPAALGVFRYLTTRYRIADGRVELERGLVSRQITTARLDRVRTVDLTASPIHRILGLTTLRVGTGVATGDADNLDLDGLDVAQARALRRQLLRGAGELGPDPSRSGDGWTAPDAGEVEWARFAPSWLRFAPFTGAGIGVAAAAVGVGAQWLVSTGDWEVRLDEGDLPSPLLLVLVGVGILLAVLGLAVAGYAVLNGNFRLTHRPGSWHLSRGLLTTRESTIDEERLAGVRVLRPVPLRWVGGASLQAIVTGVDRSQRSSSSLLPPAPAAVADHVATGVVGEDAADGPLRRHGPAAARRRWTRALLPTLPFVLAALVATLVAGWWWLLVPAVLLVGLAALLAADRVRALGHAHRGGALVSRSGSLMRSRDVLGESHVIGWTLRSTWFQRRVGLVTLTATTAGGRGRVDVLDVPRADAVALAQAVQPGLLEAFRHPARTEREAPPRH